MDPHTEHDSKTNPIEGCVECQREVFRRTHKCYGDGSSSIPVPPPIQEVPNE